MSFSAQYPGTCPCGCGVQIRPNVTKMEYDEDYGFVIKGHPIEQKVCPSCQIVLPATGKCDDCD